jgi:hypothetical protein
MKLIRFYNTNLPECKNVIFEEEVKMWHQHYSNETPSRIPSRTVKDDLDQCDKIFYLNIFLLLKICAILPLMTSTSVR